MRFASDIGLTFNVHPHCQLPEKSSPAVRRAEGGYRSTGVFGIHEPRSHREEVGHVRDDLDDVDVVVGGGGERVVVFLQTLVEGEQPNGGRK